MDVKRRSICNSRCIMSDNFDDFMFFLDCLEKRNYPVDTYSRENEFFEHDVADEQTTVEKSPTYLEIVEDYFPCSALELPVREGEIVTYIESEGVWIYVRAENGSDGYIPRRHCRLIDLSELKISETSDVGYYSDSRHDSCYPETRQQHRHEVSDVRRHSSKPQQHHRHNHCRRKYHSMGDVHESISSGDSSPASSNHSTVQQHKPRTFSNVAYYRQFGNNQQRRTEQEQARFQISNATLSPDKKPVCGRKCKDNCEHKYPNKASSEQTKTQAATPFTYKLHKSSVISVSSGQSNNYAEQSMCHSFHEMEKRSERTYESHIKEHEHENSYKDNEPGETSEYGNHGDKGEDSSKSDKNNNKVQIITGVKEPSRKAPDIIRAPCGHPELIVIENYEKQGETDITVDRGDYAAIINDTKYKDWIYILNEKGDRGFIPTRCVIKHECHGMS